MVRPRTGQDSSKKRRHLRYNAKRKKRGIESMYIYLKNGSNIFAINTKNRKYHYSLFALQKNPQVT